MPATSDSRNQCVRSRLPSQSGPEENSGRLTRGGWDDSAGEVVMPALSGALLVEDLRQEAGDAGPEQVDRDPADDVVDAEGDGGDGVDQPAHRARGQSGQQRRHGAPLVAGPAGEPGAEHHHAFEPDVDHAGPLGPQAAQPGQADRHRQHQRGGERARGGDVVGAGHDPDQRHQKDQHGDADERQVVFAGPGRSRDGRGRHAATSTGVFLPSS
jgi:hypothetical protein